MPKERPTEAVFRRSGDRRYRWHNVLSTLPKYARLLSGVEQLTEPVPTAELQEFAGLTTDLNGTLGALFMLEAVGVVHPIRGLRRQYIWHPGPRRSKRPSGLPDLLPYERLPKLLRHFGLTPVGTDPIMRDVHFGDKHGRRERLLGALKTLVVLGVAAYDEDEAGWFYASANAKRRYISGMFGRT